jgi:hypothetical protein
MSLLLKREIVSVVDRLPLQLFATRLQSQRPGLCATVVQIVMIAMTRWWMLDQVSSMGVMIGEWRPKP